MDHFIVETGLRVPDLDASIEHVEATLGLIVAERDDSQAKLAFPERSPCLVLKKDDQAALDYILLLTTEENLKEIIRRAEDAGITVHDGRESGTVRLYAPNKLAVEFAVGKPEERNTQERDSGPRVGSLDHVSLKAKDLDGTVSFFMDILGFRLADSVGDVRHWLRCSPNHHTVAIFEGGDTLHHYAFEADDLNQLGRLGDLLFERDQNFMWGPGRHGIGENIFTYHLDPAGTILEVTCGMVQVPDEDKWVTQVWDPNTLASAVRWGPAPTSDFRDADIPIYDHGEL